MSYPVKVIICIFFVACNNSSNSIVPDNKSADSVSNVKSYSRSKEIREDTIGFLSNCDQWKKGLSEGSLQGLDINKDSLEDFCFYECYDCKETFEIAFAYKNKNEKNKEDLMWSEFSKGCSNKFEKFNCYAFVYPMVDPDKQKDVHEINIRFPVTVRAYRRIDGDRWHLIKKEDIKDFHDLSLLRFQTIYNP